MRVTRIELSNLCNNSEIKTHTAQLQFFLTDGNDGATMTTSLNCRMLALDAESRTDIHDGLLRDAIRQLQWMPEVRFGTVSLSDLPEITDLTQKGAAA